MFHIDSFNRNTAKPTDNDNSSNGDGKMEVDIQHTWCVVTYGIGLVYSYYAFIVIKQIMEQLVLHRNILLRTLRMGIEYYEKQFVQYNLLVTGNSEIDISK